MMEEEKDWLTNLPQSAFTASDVVSFYLHRGSLRVPVNVVLLLLAVVVIVGRWVIVRA